MALPFGPRAVADTTPTTQRVMYASPSGSGNTASLANPCGLYTMPSLMQAGDVWLLRGGTYTFNQSMIISIFATASNPVIIESYPGETAIIDGSTIAPLGNVQFWAHCKFVHFRKLIFQNMPRRGIYITGSDNLVEGVTARNNALTGIQIAAANTSLTGSRNIIRDCTSHGNSDVGLSSPGNNGNNANGITCSLTGYDNIYEYCLAYENSDDGIDCFGGVRTIIRYCISHSNGPLFTGGAGDGHGFKMGTAKQIGNNTIHHCLSYYNSVDGISWNSGEGTTIYNCTTNGNAGVGYALGSGDVTAYENIAGEAEPKRGGNTGTDNSWNRGGTVAFISTDPLNAAFLVPSVGGGFEDIGAWVGVNPSLPDLTITGIAYDNGVFTATVENSGDIDTPGGTDVVVTYTVNGVDIGATGTRTTAITAGATVDIGTDSGTEYTLQPGANTVIATVDASGTIDEYSTTNNSYTALFTIADAELPFVSSPITASIDLNDSDNLPAQLSLFFRQIKEIVPTLNTSISLLDLSDYQTTSVTSNAIGTGSKTFVVDGDKLFQKGMFLTIADNAAPNTNYMIAQVDSYSEASLSVTSMYSAGTGTLTDWVISFSAPAQPFVTDNEVIVTGQNGRGSTNTAIPRFTTVYRDVGTDITYADSATLGASFTINRRGIYGISYTAGSTTSNLYLGLSLNSSQLSTNIVSITNADRLIIEKAADSNKSATVFTSIELDVGDVVRPHISTSDVLLSTQRLTFSMIKALS